MQELGTDCLFLISIPTRLSNTVDKRLLLSSCRGFNLIIYYRPLEGGHLYDMKVVSGYAFLRTYFV